MQRYSPNIGTGGSDTSSWIVGTRTMNLDAAAQATLWSVSKRIERLDCCVIIVSAAQILHEHGIRPDATTESNRTAKTVYATKSGYYFFYTRFRFRLL
jgi:hypothetical protein